MFIYWCWTSFCWLLFSGVALFMYKITLVGAFTKLRKAANSFVMPVHPRGTTQQIFVIFDVYFSRKQKFH